MLASVWAESALPGQELWIAGPGAGFEPAADLAYIVMAADETALPGAAMILEALPETCQATILLEVEDAGEERPISDVRACKPTWLHRASANRPSCHLLEEKLKATEAPDDAFWWIACESGAMRRMREHLLKERGVPRDQMITRGYWQAGESNHPDHDYGE